MVASVNYTFSFFHSKFFALVIGLMQLRSLFSKI